jgi:hypothetical protein
MVLRPTTLLQEPPVVNPQQEYSFHRFYQLSGFWPNQFIEVADILLDPYPGISFPPTWITQCKSVYYVHVGSQSVPRVNASNTTSGLTYRPPGT